MAERPSQKALAEFVAEAQEIVDALDRGLVVLEDSRRGEEADPEALNAVFRAAHSLKGLAAMVGVERMTALAHALEDRLDDVRMGRGALDRATLEVLLAAPGVFAEILAEEAGGKPPATVDATAHLAARLRAGAGPAHAASAAALERLDLDAAVRAVLTAYEEHRLTVNVEKGARVYRVGVRFDLERFGAGLDALKKALQPAGEVISTLPSSDASDLGAIAFDVLFGSAEPIEAVRRAAGPDASVEEIPLRGSTGSPRTDRGAPARPSTPVARAAYARDERGGDAFSVRPEPFDSGADRTYAQDRLREAESRGRAELVADPEPSLRSISQMVRVDIGKLDRLMNLVGELVIVKTSLLSIAERLRQGDESATLGLELHRESRSLDRKLAELQGGVLEVRMVPLGQVFDKLARMVRKLARELGKQVELQVRGGEVELDKLIVEELSDPLMHLIRNAIDHAVEAPEVRARLGKPSVGRVELSAAQKGNHVVIAVEDDGAGIDEGRIREVAVQRGLASADSVAQLSRREVMNLIFVPGFSTAREVTAVSGRGVGMDVVKSNIATMSGIIDLHSEPGTGTRFEITLPVTLAIIRALVATSAGRTYAVPLNAVLEIVALEASEVRTIELREVMSLRGTTLPLVRLDRYLGAPAAHLPSSSYVVVVGLAHERLGLVVDGLVGQQDVVVKPLGRALAGVRGIAGATDLGNRRTVLVLDVAAVIDEVARGSAIAQAVS